jgi:hypothetical protein
MPTRLPSYPHLTLAEGLSFDKLPGVVANTYQYPHFTQAGGLFFFQSSRMDTFSPYQPSSPPWQKDFSVSQSPGGVSISANLYPHFYPSRNLFLLPIARSRPF